MMFRVILLSCFLPATINALIVEIDQGAVNGTVLRSRNGDYVNAFYGIPYAQPPVGGLRFEVRAFTLHFVHNTESFTK